MFKTNLRIINTNYGRVQQYRKLIVQQLNRLGLIGPLITKKKKNTMTNLFDIHVFIYYSINLI